MVHVVAGIHLLLEYSGVAFEGPKLHSPSVVAAIGGGVPRADNRVKGQVGCQGGAGILDAHETGALDRHPTIRGHHQLWIGSKTLYNLPITGRRPAPTVSWAYVLLRPRAGLPFCHRARGGSGVAACMARLSTYQTRGARVENGGGVVRIEHHRPIGGGGDGPSTSGGHDARLTAARHVSFSMNEM